MSYRRQALLQSIAKEIGRIEAAQGKPLPSWRLGKDPDYLARLSIRRLETIEGGLVQEWREVAFSIQQREANLSRTKGR